MGEGEIVRTPVTRQEHLCHKIETLTITTGRIRSWSKTAHKPMTKKNV